jgi:hypothetical protein
MAEAGQINEVLRGRWAGTSNTGGTRFVNTVSACLYYFMIIHIGYKSCMQM